MYSAWSVTCRKSLRPTASRHCTWCSLCWRTINVNFYRYILVFFQLPVWQFHPTTPFNWPKKYSRGDQNYPATWSPCFVVPSPSGMRYLLRVVPDVPELAVPLSKSKNLMKLVMKSCDVTPQTEETPEPSSLNKTCGDGSFVIKEWLNFDDGDSNADNEELGR